MKNSGVSEALRRLAWVITRPPSAKRSPFVLFLLTSCVLGLPSCGSGPAVQQMAGPQKANQLRIMSLQLADGMVGQPYSYQITASGGGPPYKWSLALGQFPPGLSLNAQTGALTGIPTQAGMYSFTVQVEDSTFSQQLTTMESFSLAIQFPSLVIVTPGLPGGAVGQPYSVRLQASGGTLPYTWSILEGSLPSGIQLNALTGEISGTPTQVGTTLVTIQVTDSSLPQNVARLMLAGTGTAKPSGLPM